MKNLRQSKHFDRIVFVCIGMAIASVIYFSVNTTDAEKDILDTGGMVVLSLVINDLNSQIISKKIDALNYSFQSERVDDFRDVIDLLKKSAQSKMDAIELRACKKHLIMSNNATKGVYELIDNIRSDFHQSRPKLDENKD
ncbi:MAG: hypothetical protein OXD54_11555 [Candidatus Poribacteria bacterium]|nr:hypothetical protein [Candidatus Poribacteria bacterium]